MIFCARNGVAQLSHTLSWGLGQAHKPRRMSAAPLAGLDRGEFTEGHELDRKWRVPKEMIGRRLSQEEALIFGWSASLDHWITEECQRS